MKSEGVAKLWIAVSILADTTKIQNDHCILDRCSVKRGWMSPKRSEKYYTQAEVVHGTNPGSRITVHRKEKDYAIGV